MDDDSDEDDVDGSGGSATFFGGMVPNLPGMGSTTNNGEGVQRKVSTGTPGTGRSSSTPTPGANHSSINASNDAGQRAWAPDWGLGAGEQGPLCMF